MIEFTLSRSTNVHRQAMDVTKASRSLLKGHKPAILWFTGLSGAGKSTIANLVERKLAAMGAHTYGARRRQHPPGPQQGPWLHRRLSASKTSAASAKSRSCSSTAGLIVTA
jgi:Mrp family chromosome partitioning ATPase